MINLATCTFKIHHLHLPGSNFALIYLTLHNPLSWLPEQRRTNISETSCTLCAECPVFSYLGLGELRDSRIRLPRQKGSALKCITTPCYSCIKTPPYSSLNLNDVLHKWNGKTLYCISAQMFDKCNVGNVTEIFCKILRKNACTFWNKICLTSTIDVAF